MDARGLFLASLLVASAFSGALAQSRKEGSSAQIIVGESAPFSGPGAPFGQIARAEMAYFNKINQAGGINHRTIKVFAADDAYSPPKALEEARKLVEADDALLVLDVGTTTGAAAEKYLNLRGVPQFPTSGASIFFNPKKSPWTMGFQPSYFIEAKIYANHILQTISHPKIAILYENNDYGKDLRAGMLAGLGSKASSLVVKQVSYETSEPTIDSEILSLQASGADVVFLASSAKFSAMALRKIYDIGWRPTRYLAGTSSSILQTLKPAGLDKSKGVIAGRFLKDPTDTSDQGVKEYLDFMKSFMPHADPSDLYNIIGSSRAKMVEHILTECGDDLSRANIMKQATHLNGLALPMLLNGIKLTSSPTDYHAIRQEQLMRFDGADWKPLTGLLSAT